MGILRLPIVGAVDAGNAFCGYHREKRPHEPRIKRVRKCLYDDADDKNGAAGEKCGTPGRMAMLVLPLIPRALHKNEHGERAEYHNRDCEDDHVRHFRHPETVRIREKERRACEKKPADKLCENVRIHMLNIFSTGVLK